MVEAKSDNRGPDITSRDEDQGEVFANHAGWFYRAWTWLERVNPHREAIMVVRVARTDESAADAALRCLGWLKRADMPGTVWLEKRNETRLVFSKKVHTIWPYDLNWDVARSVILTLDRHKIRYQSLIVDVSKGIPPWDFYWWPLDVATYVRQHRNGSNSNNGQSSDSRAKLEPPPLKSALRPNSPPQPDASARRMLSETRFYSKSDGPEIAQQEWSDYTLFRGFFGVRLWKRNVGRPANMALNLWARVVGLVAMLIGGLSGWFARGGSHARLMSWSIPLLMVPLVIAIILAIIIGLLLIWRARMNVPKSALWKEQDGLEALKRKRDRLFYLLRLTRADLEVASIDRRRVRWYEEWGSSLVVVAFLGGNFAYGAYEFPRDRSGAWIAGIAAATVGLVVIGFIWRHFARFSVRMVGATLAGTTVFLSAGLVILRILYHRYYSTLGIHSDVDISQSDLVRVGGPLAVQLLINAAVAAAIWLCVYRHRFAQPFNWLLASVLVLGAILPLASAVDDASHAGSSIGSGKSNPFGHYAASVVCVRPIGHDPVPIEYDGRSSLNEGQTAQLWQIGTAGTQTLLLDPVAAATVHDHNEKSGSGAAVPVQYVPSSTITIRQCDPGAAK